MPHLDMFDKAKHIEQASYVTLQTITQHTFSQYKHLQRALKFTHEQPLCKVSGQYFLLRGSTLSSVQNRTSERCSSSDPNLKDNVLGKVVVFKNS